MPYSQLLSESGLDTLKHRRERALANLADKTSKNPNYTDYFPPNTSERGSQRIGLKQYKEKFARTQRLYNSPLYTIRRLLNNTKPEPPNDTTDLDLSHLFTEP